MSRFTPSTATTRTSCPAGARGHVRQVIRELELHRLGGRVGQPVLENRGRDARVLVIQRDERPEARHRHLQRNARVGQLIWIGAGVALVVSGFLIALTPVLMGGAWEKIQIGLQTAPVSVEVLAGNPNIEARRQRAGQEISRIQHGQ